MARTWQRVRDKRMRKKFSFRNKLLIGLLLMLITFSCERAFATSLWFIVVRIVLIIYN